MKHGYEKCKHWYHMLLWDEFNDETWNKLSKHIRDELIVLGMRTRK